jgi:hypothetical protein
MMMGVLKLMDISHLWKVFLVDMGLSLQLAHTFEHAAIWFIYFHLLKLLVP